ncbi:MAG: cytochrome c oxidase subunit 3 [Bacteroidota bacterium]
MDKINLKRQQHLLIKRQEPFRFMLLLGIFGSAMLFLLLTVIYLSRKSGSDWIAFELPTIFWFSTLIMTLSSLTLQQANRAFKAEHFFTYRLQMGATLTLGLLFITMQLMGWNELIEQGITLGKSTAGAFVYLLSGLHILHILLGLIFLLILFTEAIRRMSYVDSFVYSVNPPNQLKMKLVSIYWHFVDVLWMCIFLFLWYQHS